jgi:hypothetical protein
MRPLERAFACALLALAAGAAQAQTTEFTYQGRLEDDGSPAGGSFDFEFRLFADAAGGTALATVQRTGVAVTDGLFTVPLDFGAQFTGAARYLEVAARPAGGGAFTTIGARQPLTASPYAIRSAASGAADALSAACTSCVTNAHVLSLAGSKITGTVPVAAVPPGSDFYIPNATAGTGTSSFNVNGSGTVASTLRGRVLDSDTTYRIDGQRVLAVGGPTVALGSLFLGVGAGAATTGDNNTFLGANAGAATIDGASNTFVGTWAGRQTSSGSYNVMVGSAAGGFNTMGQGGTFVGSLSGGSNTWGSDNTFVGHLTGFGTTSGDTNTYVGSRAGQLAVGSYGVFVGYSAGYRDQAGANTFIGHEAGRDNETGSFNTFVGFRAGRENTGQSNTFVGHQAGVDNRNGLGNTFVGESAGTSNTTASRNTALGVSAGSTMSTASDNTMIGASAGRFTTTGGDNTVVGSDAGLGNTTGHHNTAIGSGADFDSNGLEFATAVGANAEVTTSNTVVLGRPVDSVRIPGILVVPQMGSVGSLALCRNGLLQLASCSSSARYKHDVERFPRGLDLVEHLRPVRFRWNDSGAADLGFLAEEVAAEEPLLATVNGEGQVEGVKYEQLGAVLVNAIQQQQRQLDRQARTIEMLLQLVCADRTDHDACRR